MDGHTIVAIEVATALTMHKMGKLSRMYDRMSLAHANSSINTMSSKNISLLKELKCITM